MDMQHKLIDDSVHTQQNSPAHEQKMIDESGSKSHLACAEKCNKQHISDGNGHQQSEQT